MLYSKARGGMPAGIPASLRALGVAVLGEEGWEGARRAAPILLANSTLDAGGEVEFVLGLREVMAVF